MSAAPGPPLRRMRIAGLHHATLICRDLDRTTAFYRDLLGLTLVRQGESDDDPGTRHFWFGDPQGTPGTLLSFLEYPAMGEGSTGLGSTHHLALAVSSPAEVAAWRPYLIDHGVPVSEVFSRGGLCSVYLRDPDAHILEITAADDGAAAGAQAPASS